MAFKLDKLMDNVVGFLVMVVIGGSAIASFFTYNTTDHAWPASTVAVWGVLVIIFVIALIYFIMPKRGKGR